MKKKLELVSDWIKSGPNVSVRLLAIMLFLSFALAALMTALEIYIRKL